MHGVRVGEQQPLRAPFFGSGNYRIVLSRPAVWQRPRRDHPHFGKTLCDLARAIGGTIVDYDDFKTHAGLGGQRFQTVAEAGLFVPGRNDDRNLGDHVCR